MKTKSQEKNKSDSMFKTVAMVSAMGDIFGETKKEKNDWKLRMLKAGFENKGLSIPDDWNDLTEDEKETRLNKVIELARGKNENNK